jgi:hypothetical protein
MRDVVRSHDGAGNYREPYGAHLAGLYRQLAETQLSNMALVSASDLRQAIEEVHLLLGVPENRTRRVQEGQHPWLFVFLGVRGSSPPAWTITSVKILPGNAIEVRYQTRAPGPETRDMHPYMAFIPLPKDTPAGSYVLRLVDDADGGVELQRRHTVLAVRPPKSETQPPKIEMPHVSRTPEQEKADAEMKRRLENERRR